VADRKAKGMLLGGVIGSLLLPGAGSAIGGVFLSWLLGKSTERTIPPPVLPSEEELIKRASLKAHLGIDPERGIRALGVKLYSDLLQADIATSETIVSAYEVLLRRVMFETEEGFMLAESASLAYKDATKMFDAAKQLWSENHKKYKEVQKVYERAAKNYERAINSLILTMVITGMMETFENYGGMSTAEYRNKLMEKGINLEGKDIDHIIPVAKGGIDHPWNYQVVPAALNRAWRDGSLFEKCLYNPIGFAKAVTIQYPGIPSAMAGAGYYYLKK